MKINPTFARICLLLWATLIVATVCLPQPVPVYQINPGAGITTATNGNISGSVVTVSSSATPTIDTRTVTNFSAGQTPMSPTSSAPIQIMTNNGPGTIQSVHFTIGGATNVLTLPNTVISIFCDGRSNGMSLANFYACSWQTMAMHNGRLDHSWDIQAGPYQGLTAYRNFDTEPVNAWTNFGVTLSCPNQSGGLAVYYDIYAAIGKPQLAVTPQLYWNCNEVNITTLLGSCGLTNLSGGRAGRLSSVVYGFVSTNLGDFGNQVYFGVDGSNSPVAGGLDDMGNSGYEGWLAWDQVDTINYGASYGYWLTQLPGNQTNGLEMFRFLPNANFTNNLTVYKGPTGTSMSNRLAVTWMSNY